MRAVSRITGVPIHTVTKLPMDAGETWTWTAIDADSKLIISWHVGPRDPKPGPCGPYKKRQE